MQPVEIKKDIFWVGALDWDIVDFHGYKVDHGTTYNAYLVKDEKTTLFDTVKHGFELDLIHRLYNAGVEPEEVDYLVVNHLEPDHSGGLPELVARLRPEKVFTSPMGEKAMRQYYDCADWPIEVVKTGSELSLGRRKVQFLETRMLHWPDSMFSYLPDDKLLISSDAFGEHLCTSERFDDQVDQAELMRQAAKYYANILLLYSPLVQKLLAQVQEMGLEIDTICPDHGVIWRGEPMKIVGAYDRWSRQEVANKALVVFDTMWHSTEIMAKAVADGITDEGMSVRVMNLASVHRSDVVTEMLDSSALVFGSATLNNGMLPRMADLLTYIRGLKPANKAVASFGSYGWSGEAVKDINAYLESMKLPLAHEGVRLKYRAGHEGLKECRELGRAVAQAAPKS
jgi:flavorubredoxin